MITATDSVHRPAAKRSLRTVAVISTHPYLHAIESVLAGMDHDIVFVEALSHAYSQIKRVMPDLIVLCLLDDDAASCQVLSMLRLDGQTAGIPVVTYAPTLFNGVDAAIETTDDTFSRFAPVSMN